MLGNAAPTPYDLRFSLFGIPVRVHPLFWVFSAVMGWGDGNLRSVAIWVGCAFVSILVHELGHALTARYFRASPEIVLYMFGGYASHYPVWGRSTARSLLILMAGPGAGFVLFGIAFALHLTLALNSVGRPRYVDEILIYLQIQNLWWSLMNLLPVYPLDGGQITSVALSHWRRYDGEQLALKISIVTAVGIIILALQFHQIYMAILFASLAFSNFEALRGGGRYR